MNDPKQFTAEYLKQLLSQCTDLAEFQEAVAWLLEHAEPRQYDA